MKHRIPEIPIRQFWKKFQNDTLPSNMPFPGTAENKISQAKTAECQQMIEFFCKVVSKVTNMVDGIYVFKLLDETGVLLKSIAGREISENLSIDIHQPVYNLPEDQYNTVLPQCNVYAKSLEGADGVYGYMVLCTYQQPVSNELTVITNLLADQIMQFVREKRKMDHQIHLTEQQKKVLKLLCGGFTEEAIALELNLSVNTIKYHKRKIFLVLDTKSTTEAVFKAAKLNLIS